MSGEACYFKVIATDGYAFPTNPQVSFGFNSQGFTLLNRGNYTIQYSFDGHYIHGDLNPTDASKGLTFDARVECQIWFRAVGGFSTVRVEAWAP